MGHLPSMNHYVTLSGDSVKNSHYIVNFLPQPNSQIYHNKTIDKTLQEVLTKTIKTFLESQQIYKITLHDHYIRSIYAVRHSLSIIIYSCYLCMKITCYSYIHTLVVRKLIFVTKSIIVCSYTY